MVMKIVKSGGIKFMRDPTRGGIGAVLNEIVEETSLNIVIKDEKIPVQESVSGAADMLGFDPYYLPCEGRVVIFSSPEKTEKILEIIRESPGGKKAQISGRVEKIEDEYRKGKVYVKTPLGGYRLLDMPSGEQLPRIC
jgi:hydrogenase expression/formation protein HypE